jgi:electron-transferring-flavoprotein dehydrogenase
MLPRLTTTGALAATSRTALKRTAQRTPSLVASFSQIPTSISTGSRRSPTSLRTSAASPALPKPFSTSPSRNATEPVNQDDNIPALEGVERVQDEVDVCIVGGGPAGLSAAIQLMKLAQEKGEEIRVVVLEKGAEIGKFSLRFRFFLACSPLLFAGAHILSGAVIETKALDELIPDWKEKGAPLNQPATSDAMRWLTSTSSFPMPHPPQMSNHGNYVISLSKLTRWLAEQAEELGVEIYPGFAGAKLLYTEDGKGIRGVCTNEIGLDKNYEPKDSFEPGMEFLAKVTLLAEGCHGSLSKQVQQVFNLREGKDPQTYGLGVKEVWKIKKENHVPGKIQHTLGWPLDNSTYGGTWLYHMEDEMVSLGIVVGLDYPNPYISPFKELQVRSLLPVCSLLLLICSSYSASNTTLSSPAFSKAASASLTELARSTREVTSRFPS